ncbi:hypothetical protein BN129_2556 [Cronobacter sakazakii 701]|nr:hypothetical protein BN129_2556 [Cronobacter sakazakii 701]
MPPLTSYPPPVTGVTEPAPLRALANRSLRYMTVRLAM